MRFSRRMGKDKEFAAELEKAAGDDAEMLSPAESEPLLRRLLDLSPAARDFANQLLKKHLHR